MSTRTAAPGEPSMSTSQITTAMSLNPHGRLWRRIGLTGHLIDRNLYWFTALSPSWARESGQSRRKTSWSKNLLHLLTLPDWNTYLIFVVSHHHRTVRTVLNKADAYMLNMAGANALLTLAYTLLMAGVAWFQGGCDLQPPVTKSCTSWLNPISSWRSLT